MDFDPVELIFQARVTRAGRNEESHAGRGCLRADVHPQPGRHRGELLIRVLALVIDDGQLVGTLGRVSEKWFDEHVIEWSVASGQWPVNTVFCWPLTTGHWPHHNPRGTDAKHTSVGDDRSSSRMQFG